jgi:hypothetical protein
MKRAVGIALLLTLVLPYALLADAADFQTGKVVAVEKQESSAPSGGTDAPVAQNRQRYNLTIQVNDQLYVCRAQTVEGHDLEWVQGKELPVMVNGKTMSIKKANGKIVKLSILSSKKAE